MPKPEKTYIGGGVHAEIEQYEYLSLNVQTGDCGMQYANVLISFEDLPALTAYLARLTEWLAEQEKP